MEDEEYTSDDSSSVCYTKKQKPHNFYCKACKKSFYFDNLQTIIRCEHCGYRIIYKKRTANHIYYKTD